jgi:LPS sulfotransferase NodH
VNPSLSYTIWFSQRTGSTLLCKTLEATGIAGMPGEWLHGELNIDNAPALQARLFQQGGTPNGIFAIKHSFHEPHFSRLVAAFRQLPGCPQEGARAAVWEYAFPHHRHIFMTRRNKVRLAVSWWRAIRSQEWHRQTGAPPRDVDLSDAYSFDAIRHLYMECTMREAGLQAFFDEGGIVPMTIVYEDFVREYVSTVREVLAFLGLDPGVEIAPPPLEPTADVVSEAWVQRFREEFQQGWTNRGW